MVTTNSTTANPVSLSLHRTLQQNIEMVEGKLIVQDWRFNTWPEGVHSRLRIELEEISHGTTKLVLTQSGIPYEDKYGNHDLQITTENGWRNMILTRIKTVFGY